jgi:transcriptional regulator with XRE-family HTH domain
MEAVSRMERGIVVPTIVRLAELAQLFECELADFLRETSSRPTEQGIVLGQKLAKLDSADRTLLLEMFERLVERLAKP